MGALKVSDLQFSHFVAPPPPIINEQSLRIAMGSNRTVVLMLQSFVWLLIHESIHIKPT